MVALNCPSCSQAQAHSAVYSSLVVFIRRCPLEQTSAAMRGAAQRCRPQPLKLSPDEQAEKKRAQPPRNGAIAAERFDDRRRLRSPERPRPRPSAASRLACPCPPRRGASGAGSGKLPPRRRPLRGCFAAVAPRCFKRHVVRARDAEDELRALRRRSESANRPRTGAALRLPLVDRRPREGAALARRRPCPDGGTASLPSRRAPDGDSPHAGAVQRHERRSDALQSHGRRPFGQMPAARSPPLPRPRDPGRDPRAAGRPAHGPPRPKRPLLALQAPQAVDAALRPSDDARHLRAEHPPRAPPRASRASPAPPPRAPPAAARSAPPRSLALRLCGAPRRLRGARLGTRRRPGREAVLAPLPCHGPERALLRRRAPSSGRARLALLGAPLRIEAALSGPASSASSASARAASARSARSPSLYSSHEDSVSGSPSSSSAAEDE